MSYLRHFSWLVVCLAALAVVLVQAQTATAQFSDSQAFTDPLGVFAVSPNPALNWSLEPECSPGVIISGRGDGGDLRSLQNQMPPSIGTRMIRDLNPGSGSSTIGSMSNSYVDVVYRIFCSADNGSGNQEYYRILDALYPAMSLKMDINPGAAGSSPANLTHQLPGAQGTVYFSADDGTNGRELWVSRTITGADPSAIDGTINEYMVADINPSGSSNPDGFSMALTPTDITKKMVLFAADNGTNGRELWRTYRDASGVHVTEMLKDINTTSAGASSNPQSMTTVTYDWSYNSKAFFTADDGVNGRELWISDGTVAGTGMLKDITAGSGSTNIENMTPAIVLTAPSPSAVFFTVGQNLWWSKGMLDGSDTLLIKDVGGTPANLTVLYNAAYTGYTLYFTVGNALWKSNGTAVGTVSLMTFASAPSSLAGSRSSTGSVLYFAADDGTGSGVELWKTDGTTTTMVKDINPGSASSTPTNIIGIGGTTTIRFSADDGTNGRELWKSGGTAETTLLIKDINPGSASSNPAQMFLTGPGSTDILFFTADDGTHGRELWQSDGFAEQGDSRTGYSYKWDLESLIKSKTDNAKIAIAGADDKVFIIGATFDMPIQGPLEDIMPAAHQINHYFEITDGTDRAPLDITYVSCGDNGILRPKAALTDGNQHNAIAFGMIAVLDQDPCSADPRGRGEAAPDAPFAYVPAIFDGLNWVPMDRDNIPPGVTTNPPTGASLGRAPREGNAGNNYLHPVGSLPINIIPAPTDPYVGKRYSWIRLEVWTDYIRAYWLSKQETYIYIATIPRQYKGGFKSLYIGNKAHLQAPTPYYFDSLLLNGGIFASSTEPYGACCTAEGCSDHVGDSSVCPDGRFSSWRACGEPATPLCCPIPWADANRDGDVDMDDFAALQRCLTTGGGPVSEECACLDKSGNGVIDITEINKFATCATGSNVAPTPAQITACDTMP